MTNPGTLFVVGTPIGNREDITLRALKVLAASEVIVCEDTRVTSRLLSLYDDQLWQALGGKPKQPHLARLDEAFETRMIPKVIDWLETGTNVTLVTDAGMPCVSDPGWRVVNAVREQGFPVEVIPGPTALTTALAGVGMDTSRVWFGGFLPKKDKKRKEQFVWVQEQLQQEMISLVVWYESPNRLRETLEEIQEYEVRSTEYGEKNEKKNTSYHVPRTPYQSSFTVAVCGELTKTHERILRGTVEEVIAQLPKEIKGEWVIVIGQ